jgi:hypothetical protein
VFLDGGTLACTNGTINNKGYLYGPGNLTATTVFNDQYGQIYVGGVGGTGALIVNGDFTQYNRHFRK